MSDDSMAFLVVGALGLGALWLGIESGLIRLPPIIGGSNGNGNNNGGDNNNNTPVAMLYPSVGRTWFSTIWSNGKVRTINETRVDPYDTNLEYTDGTPSAPMVINGDGTATIHNESTSYRIYVKGPWLNTEMTVYARFRGVARDIQLHSRSSHELGGPFNIPQCHFAGYHVIWDRNTKQAMVECEVLSSIIARNLVSRPIPAIPLNKWTGFKQITRTLRSQGYVKVEGYMQPDPPNGQWQKSVEYTFTGKPGNADYTVLHNVNDGWHDLYVSCKNLGAPPATDLIKNSAWIQPETMCWIRINDAKDVDLKLFSVREIAGLA